MPKFKLGTISKKAKDTTLKASTKSSFFSSKYHKTRSLKTAIAVKAAKIINKIKGKRQPKEQIDLFEPVPTLPRNWSELDEPRPQTPEFNSMVEYEPAPVAPYDLDIKDKRELFLKDIGYWTFSTEINKKINEFRKSPATQNLADELDKINNDLKKFASDYSCQDKDFIEFRKAVVDLIENKLSDEKSEIAKHRGWVKPIFEGLCNVLLVLATLIIGYVIWALVIDSASVAGSFNVFNTASKNLLVDLDKLMNEIVVDKDSKEPVLLTGGLVS